MHNKSPLTQNQQQAKCRNNNLARSAMWLMIVTVSMMLSACGNKGDLYLPDKEDASQQQTADGEQSSRL